MLVTCRAEFRKTPKHFCFGEAPGAGECAARHARASMRPKRFRFGEAVIARIVVMPAPTSFNEAEAFPLRRARIERGHAMSAPAASMRPKRFRFGEIPPKAPTPTSECQASMRPKRFRFGEELEPSIRENIEQAGFNEAEAFPLRRGSRRS